MPVKELHDEDVDTAPLQPTRPARVWEPDPSGEAYLFVRTRDHDTQIEITMRDVGIQTSTWQSYSSDELENEVVFRLSNVAFSRTYAHPVPLRPDSNKRH